MTAVSPTVAGWRPYGDPIAETRVVKSVLAADALLLGRRYELLSSFWPTADPNDPRTQKLNSHPKYVVSRTLGEATWHNTTLLQCDLIEQTAKLKELHTEISIWGSTTIIQQLLRNDLIDEFILLVYPLILGSGKKLFNLSPTLKLTETTTSPTGIAIHTYHRTPPTRQRPTPPHQPVHRR